MAAWIYSSDARIVSLSLKAEGYPTHIEIPHVAWPGVPGITFDVSGQHSAVLSAVLPNKIGSESAKGFAVVSVNRSRLIGINPAGPFARAENTEIPVYAWEDWLVVPHNSFRVPFFHSPSLEEFHLGLGVESPVWAQFPDGGTFCSHSQTLSLKPSRMGSCLGDRVATLSCSRQGPLRCGQGQLIVLIGGSSVEERAAVISPFDQRLEFSNNGSDTRLCSRLGGDYYYDRSLVEVRIAGGGVILSKSGEEVVAPLRATDEARIVAESIVCGVETGYLAAGTVNVGLLGSGLSFVYSPASGTLEIYETKSNSMRNSWFDVIVINACLALLVHWFFDEKKNVSSAWTYVPEILGFLFAGIGVWFQGYDTGAYYRVEDIHGAQTAVVVLFWVFGLCVIAHASSFFLTVELQGQSKAEEAVANVRKFSYEAMLILSIFVQTMSGSMDVLDSYVSFMVGFSLVYNTSYRFAEMWFSRTNHWSVILLSFSSLVAASYIFYVTTAMPAMDPVASLSRFAHEASVLSTVSAFLFAVVERSSHNRETEIKMKKKL